VKILHRRNRQSDFCKYFELEEAAAGIDCWIALALPLSSADINYSQISNANHLQENGFVVILSA
jgi:hypothetical protein